MQVSNLDSTNKSETELHVMNRTVKAPVVTKSPNTEQVKIASKHFELTIPFFWSLPSDMELYLLKMLSKKIQCKTRKG